MTHDEGGDDEVIEAEIVDEDEVIEPEVDRQGELDAAFHRGFAEGRGTVFEPGDRVLCLLLGKLMAGTVQKVQMPGPIRLDHTVQVTIDEIITDDAGDTMWFHPEQVERLGE